MKRDKVTRAQLSFLLEAYEERQELADTPYSSPFLQLLVSADSGRLAHSFIERFFAPGEVIFREGETGDTMFLIRSGRVAIFKGDFDAPTMLVCRKVGELIGEMTLLDNQPRSATVVALEELNLLGIDRQHFQELLQETPSVSLGIMEMLSATLRQTDRALSTGELSEKRLIRQVSELQSEKERLEEIQRLRQETTELIIHDLRNPLSAIAVSLKMLSMMLPPDTLESNREIIEVAQASYLRMQHLVDNLLEISRMEAGETQFVMARCDLGNLIEEVVQRAVVVERRPIQLQTRIAPGLPLLMLDRDKIERVLTNLLDNALKYTPDQGCIFTAARQEAGYLQVSVTDSGPGIPPEERERIFERFAQASGAPRRRGYGLGLAYCRLAVQGHGGRIWVEPGEEGVGSRFIFTLPV